jgi:hypothetical protein
VTVATALALRILYVRLVWRRLRNDLSSDDPGASVVGAWTWAVLALVAARMPLPPHVSPDVAATTTLPEVPAHVSEQMIPLARAATTAAFSYGAGTMPKDAATAWQLADQVRDVVRGSLTLHRRSRQALATVPMRGAMKTRGVVNRQPVGLGQ